MSNELITTFAKMARPIMLRYMTKNSCIAAARTTVETMRLFHLKAVEKPVAFFFHVPAREYVRISGVPIEDRAEMKKKAKSYLEETTNGWNGHLVVIVEDRWLLDAAIDQADAPQFGVCVPPEVFSVDTVGQQWNPAGKFDLELGVVLDNGDKATITYRSIDDPSYRETEAWKDEGLPFLAAAIAQAMRGIKQ